MDGIRCLSMAVRVYSRNHGCSTEKSALHSLLSVILQPSYLLGHKPDYAGGTKFTIQFRITADKTLFT